MKIINVSQAHETEAWLDERVGRITGTKSGGLALEHYAQTDVEKLKEYRDKALEQAKKAKTPDKANEYYTRPRTTMRRSWTPKPRTSGLRSAWTSGSS